MLRQIVVPFLAKGGLYLGNGVLLHMVVCRRLSTSGSPGGRNRSVAYGLGGVGVVPAFGRL